MKIRVMVRVLFGLLMILFLGSQDSCDSSSANGVITIVNTTHHNLLVTIDDGGSIFLSAKWTIEEGGLSSGWHTVKWYTDYEPHYWIGSESVELVGDYDGKTVVIAEASSSGPGSVSDLQ